MKHRQKLLAKSTTSLLRRPDAFFLVKLDRPRVERCSGITNRILGIDRFSRRMLFGDGGPVGIHQFGKVINHFLGNLGVRDDLHIAHVDAGDRFFEIGISFRFNWNGKVKRILLELCLLYTSPSPRDATLSRMPSSA